jgi:hypothetical protein
MLYRSLSADQTGVIVDDIEAAKIAYGTLNSGFDIFFAGDVGSLKNRAATIFSTFAHGFFAAFLVKVDDDDRSALTREANRSRAAHATGCPTDYCIFVIKPAHVKSPPILTCGSQMPIARNRLISLQRPE